MTVCALILLVSQSLATHATQSGLIYSMINKANVVEKRSVPRAVGAILQGAKLITRDGNYRMFEKKGGFPRAEAEFSLLRPSNIVKSGNMRYGKLEDTTVVLIKERRGGVINVWKNRKRSDGSIEIQKIDRIRYCCEKHSEWDLD